MTAERTPTNDVCIELMIKHQREMLLGRITWMITNANIEAVVRFPLHCTLVLEFYKRGYGFFWGHENDRIVMRLPGHDEFIGLVNYPSVLPETRKKHARYLRRRRMVAHDLDESDEEPAPTFQIKIAVGGSLFAPDELVKCKSLTSPHVMAAVRRYARGDFEYLSDQRPQMSFLVMNDIIAVKHGVVWAHSKAVLVRDNGVRGLVFARAPCPTVPFTSETSEILD